MRCPDFLPLKNPGVYFFKNQLCQRYFNANKKKDMIGIPYSAAIGYTISIDV
jgi:hypothetical protein